MKTLSTYICMCVYLSPPPICLQHEGVAAAGAEGLAALAKLMSSRQRVGRNSELRAMQRCILLCIQA